MALDPVLNFARVVVSTGYDADDTAIALETDEGAKLPQPSTDGAFNLIWWNYTDYKNPTDDPNVEIVRVTARTGDNITVTRAQESTSGSTKNTADKVYYMILSFTKKSNEDIDDGIQTSKNNLLKNGNFINNSSNGYGSTPDDWVNSNANPVQGGFPSMTKAQLIALLGISDGDIEGLWPLNEASGNATDLSSNEYDLTDTNSVLSSDDGLMGKARDFEADNSEELTIADANCANLEISGSQTWFCWAKAETIGDKPVMGKRATYPTTNKELMLRTGSVSFRLGGLTPSESVTKFRPEADKWDFICGIYNASTNKTIIWVNGIKTETSVTGSPTDTNADFNIGSNGAEFFDGLIQNACILSVALTDSQVKKLWAYTTYKGIKIRRATTDAILYQDLPEDILERLKGKEVSIVAKMYQEVANTGVIGIYDGTDYFSTAVATTGSWIEVGKTITVSATAQLLRPQFRAITSDGNVWFKEVAVYEGGTLVYVWYPSYDDITRFPRLLKLDPPKMCLGKPYQYEENRWFNTRTPEFTGAGSLTYTSVTIDISIFMFSGKTCSLIFSSRGTTGGTTEKTIYMDPPILSSTRIGSFFHAVPALFYDSAAVIGYFAIYQASPQLNFTKLANWGLGATKDIKVATSYEID